MYLDIVHQLLAVYDERLGKLFPNDHPWRVITVLSLCREGKFTQSVIVERSGFGQSASSLVRKFRTAKLVESPASDKRGSQRIGLTEEGLRLVADFENDLRQVLLKVPAEQRGSGQAIKATEESSEKTAEHASILPDNPESEGATGIYKAYVERFPETIVEYDKWETRRKDSGPRLAGYR
jgi:hypothetical protein